MLLTYPKVADCIACLQVAKVAAVTRVAMHFSPPIIPAHATTPKVVKAAAKVAKRATAALVSITDGFIFLSILHIAREHIRVWVK